MKTVEEPSKKTEVKRGRPRTTNVLGSNTKEKVILAYKELISKRATADISLDDICQKAQIKKGSLLYHFGSKEGLQKIIVERYVEHLENCYQDGIKKAQSDWPNHEPTVAGFVEWYRHFSEITDESYSKYGVAVLSLTAGNQTLIAPVNKWYESVFSRIRKASEGNRKALMVILAIEGLFFLAHFNVSVPSYVELNSLLKDLLELAHK